MRVMDTFWAVKIQDYTSQFSLFFKMMKEGCPDIEMDTIESLWHHFHHNICDCEGCREEEDCTVHIPCEDEDTFIE